MNKLTKDLPRTAETALRLKRWYSLFLDPLFHRQVLSPTELPRHNHVKVTHKSNRNNLKHFEPKGVMLMRLLDWFDSATIAVLAKGWPEKAFMPILVTTIIYFGVHLVVFAIKHLGWV